MKSRTPPIPPPVLSQRNAPPLAPPTVPVYLLHRLGVECPRCGYDLHGAVESWADSCPLEGHCPECGLTFRWSHVLIISKFEPKWCIEFAIGRSRLPLACVKTLCVSLIPPWFWTSLHMSSTVNWKRLGLYVAMLLAMIAVFYAGVQTLRASLVYSAVVQKVRSEVAHAQANIDAAKARIATISVGNEPWVVEAQVAEQNALIAEHQAFIDTPPVIEKSFFVAVGEAIFMPTSSTASGVIAYHDGSYVRYPSPAEYFRFLGPNTAGPYAPAGRTILNVFGLSMILVALLPATFVLLPASRRKAKVQWRHIGRIAIYSLGVPAVVLMWLVFFLGLNWIPDSTGYVPRIVWSAPGLMWLIMPVWWWVAIRIYLRMSHAGSVAFLMTLMILLLVGPFILAMQPAWLQALLLSFPQ